MLPIQSLTIKDLYILNLGRPALVLTRSAQTLPLRLRVPNAGTMMLCAKRPLLFLKIPALRTSSVELKSVMNPSFSLDPDGFEGHYYECSLGAPSPISAALEWEILTGLRPTFVCNEYNRSGWSVWVGVASIILLIPVPGYMAKLVQLVQRERLKRTHERVQSVSEARLIKIELFGWEEKMKARIGNRKPSC
ncbi:hypothetical protein B0H14DRAFT_2560769 [Mycena olivaceomarginata]|nr:hypothetical protein B0H14DRAFT_2560769 [Mycena olivaceomarginata]